MSFSKKEYIFSYDDIKNSLLFLSKLKISNILYQIGDNMKYIVLLRGINISGKNKISMSELKVELSNYYEDVITYINSGNIVKKYEL